MYFPVNIAQLFYRAPLVVAPKTLLWYWKSGSLMNLKHDIIKKMKQPKSASVLLKTD